LFAYVACNAVSKITLVQRQVAYSKCTIFADVDKLFLIHIISDMARVYNWDVKRRQSEKTSAS